MKTLDPFKIRCSAIGSIMTNGKKAGELSKTTQSYLDEWAKSQIYGKRKEIKSKYFDKGLQMEDAAIDFLSSQDRFGLMIKNEDYFENDFMTGTPDVILKDEIIDTKCSWDCFSFPLFDSDLPESNYFWQMQGYMALCDKPKARVIYCLMNTPEPIIEREIKSFFWDKDEIDTDIIAEIRAKHSYDLTPLKFRIKEFAVYRDEESIERIKTRVIECREYLTKL
jgi:hypothetical protein